MGCRAGRSRDDNLECWVAVSSVAYGSKLAARGVQDPQEAVEDLQEELENVLRVFSAGKALPAIVSSKAMKWGCAFRSQILQESSLLDWENGIAACGDFCKQALAEGALLSGQHLADQILSHGS